MSSKPSAAPSADNGWSQYEIIDCRELARRWTLPESWVRAHVRDGVPDPIPHVRFGSYVRFRWGSPELNSWLERRTVPGTRSSAKTAARWLGPAIKKRETRIAAETSAESA